MTRKRISFVVLNWNGIHDTLPCLDSIRKQTVTDYEIIVVDNGSAEDQKETLRSIKDITLVDLPVNTGFTGGQIAGLEQASGDYVALINNDAVIAPDWGKNALKVFETADFEHIAAVGGRAYSWDESKDEKPFVTENPFYSYQVVDPKTGHTRTLTYGDKTVSVNSISGSGVMISRKAIDKVGYFDPDFFAYYEETDLFARFKRAGFHIIYEPTLHTWHKIAQSTRSKPDFYLYQMHRNRFLFAVKNYDKPYLRHFLWTYKKEWLRALASILRHGKSKRIEQKNLVKAGLWNAKHLFGTYKKRREVQSEGSSYSSLLFDDAWETITVVIPAYNYQQYVAEAIESVLKQTLLPDEIIVIDDGSTDKTLEVINKYKDDVTVVTQKNSGVIKTKNRGLDMATSDWIIFFDADDILDKTYLQTLSKEARLHHADVVYTAMEFIGAESGIFTSRHYSKSSLMKGNYVHNSALIRRALLLQTGGYKQALHFGYEDWELYLGLAEINARFYYVSDPLFYYRRHEGASRDLDAQSKLEHAKAEIQSLHPGLYNRRHKIYSALYAMVTFGHRRTPMQALRDIRYLFITKLDSLSKHSKLLEKLLAFARLISSGQFGTIYNKVKLNIKRVWRKVVR